MKKTRKHYTAEEKVAILRRHLLEQEPVSKLCDELGLQPTVLYRRQKEFFENGAAAFQTQGAVQPQPQQERLSTAWLVTAAERVQGVMLHWKAYPELQPSGLFGRFAWASEVPFARRRAGLGRTVLIGLKLIPAFLARPLVAG